jgi:hypothetical protein
MLLDASRGEDGLQRRACDEAVGIPALAWRPRAAWVSINQMCREQKYVLPARARIAQ